MVSVILMGEGSYYNTFLTSEGGLRNIIFITYFPLYITERSRRRRHRLNGKQIGFTLLYHK